MIRGYSLDNWLLFLIAYSFFGWIFESTYVSIKEKKLVNRGFLHGPFLPIYGTGAVMMLYISSPFKDNLVLTYIAGLIGATLLEFFVGASLEAIFKVRYWDYSPKRFNYKGHICLSSSIAWGFFTIGMNLFIHPAMLKFLADIPAYVISVLLPIVSSIILVDTGISVREALDLRDAILRLEEMHQEALLLRKRADVVLACIDDSFAQFIKEHPALERVEEVHKTIEKRFELVRDSIRSIDEQLAKKHQGELAELEELRRRFEQMKAVRQNYHRDRIRRLGHILRRNPSMNSFKYKNAFASIRRGLDREED